jgi:hypothetical protein
MPALETSDLLQSAVLWPFSGSYDPYGQPTVAAPVAVEVRWVDKRMEALDPKGDTITVDGFAIVDRHVDVGSLMWLGCPDGLVTEEDVVPPKHNWGSLVQVKTYNNTPDVRGREQRRKVGLMRWKDELPVGVELPTSTSLSASPNPSAWGQPLTIVAAVVGLSPTGNVEFYSGNTIIGNADLNVATGTATLVTTTLDPEGHALSAKYLGDQYNLGSISPTISQQVV